MPKPLNIPFAPTPGSQIAIVTPYRTYATSVATLDRHQLVVKKTTELQMSPLVFNQVVEIRFHFKGKWWAQTAIVDQTDDHGVNWLCSLFLTDQPSRINQRGHDREALQLPVRIQMGTRVIRTVTKDVSLSGIRILTHQSMLMGYPVTIGWPHRVSWVLTGHVVRMEAKSRQWRRNLYEVACEFDPIPESLRSDVIRLVYPSSSSPKD